MSKIIDMAALQREQGKWAQGTFPAQTIVAKIKHLRKEVDELLENPTDRSELADCFLLLLDIARKNNMTASDLFEASVAKFRINQMRKWGPPDEDGICEHVREVTA